MGSYLHRILECDEPLRADERESLSQWKFALEEDCQVFGMTADDKFLIRQISKRLANG